MTFFSKMEGILKDYSDRNLKVLEFYYGIRLKLFRAIQDTHTSVYGAHAGAKATQVDEFTGILVSDDFFASGPSAAGNFEEGFLYTSYKGVKTGDQIHVKSKDGKSRQFEVVSKDTIGTQESVFSKWKLSNLAG